MHNYYEILGVDFNTPSDVIMKEVSKQRKKWTMRLNAPELEQRQKAEQMIQILAEAEVVFTNEAIRANYDNILKGENNQGRTQETTELLDQMFPNKSIIELMADAYAEKRYKDVISMALKLYEDGERTLEVYVYLSECYRLLGGFAETEKYSLEGIEKFPNALYLYINLISVYGEYYKDFDKAQQYIEKSKAIDPSNMDIWDNELKCALLNYGCCKISYDKAEEIAEKFNRTEAVLRMIERNFTGYFDGMMTFNVEANGYFKTQENIDQAILAVEQAIKYAAEYGSESVKRYKNKKIDVEKQNKKNLNKDIIKYWAGMLVVAIILGRIAGVITAIISAVIAIAAAMLIYTSFEPVWQTQYTNAFGENKIKNRYFANFKKLFAKIGEVLKELPAAIKSLVGFTKKTVDKTKDKAQEMKAAKDKAQAEKSSEETK